MSDLDISIAITTKNRRDDLRRALTSCQKQTGQVEIIVVDDGSTDGTADLVKQDFPSVKLYRFERSEGCVRRRNFVATVAKAPVILSLDDDAELSGSQIVVAACSAFAHPRVAAVALPYIDVRQDSGLVKQRPRNGEGLCALASYIGTAHVIRKDVFLNLGGYREDVVHQGEESDYCIRLLDAGFLVASCEADPILHYESPRRDFERMDVYGRRNDVLFAWWNVPMPFLPLHLAGTILNGIRFGIAQRRLRPMLRGLWRGCTDAVRLQVPRHPVRIRTYLLHRHLKKRGPVPIASITGFLGPRPGGPV